MPQASNFTIKDGSSTPADVLFTNLQAASGNLPAVYQARSKGPTAAVQPKISISSKGQGKAREVRITYSVPQQRTDPVTGFVTTVDAAFAELRFVQPDNVTDAVRADLVAYVSNSVQVPQLKDACTTGYAPN